MSTSSDLSLQIEEAVDRKLDEKLRSIIRDEIKDALKQLPAHQCRFDISNHECQAVVKYVHSVARLSPDRDIDDGLDVIRDNHKWLQGLRRYRMPDASGYDSADRSQHGGD